MRRLLGTLIATAALGVTAGCGSSSSSVATGPASDPAGHASWPPGVIEGANVLPLISMTGGGGRRQKVATSLNSRADVRAFIQQFRVPALRHRIQHAVQPETKFFDHDLVGQVVAVGCDRPPAVDVIADADGQVELVPREVASPLQECLAEVTTVAIAVLPSN